MGLDLRRKERDGARLGRAGWFILQKPQGAMEICARHETTTPELDQPCSCDLTIPILLGKRVCFAILQALMSSSGHGWQCIMRFEVLPNH